MDIKTKTVAPPRAPKYHRLTSENRIIIWTLKKEGKSPAYIAKSIGCHRSTICRELERNKSKRNYRAKKAQKTADYRVRKKAADRRKLTAEIWSDAIAKVEMGWTFEQVSGRAKRDGEATVCKETFYKEYYRLQELARKGKSDIALPLLPKRRKKRKTRDRYAKKYRNAGRGKIPDRVDINDRPQTVENRKRVGHFEGDLIAGLHGTGYLVTLVERMTRFVFVAYAATKESETVMAAIIGMLANIPKDMLKTLTFDNGKEFALFKQLEQALGLQVYFAHPYHSWERGTNENRNGIVRMVLPKGRSFDDITGEEMHRIDYMLNDRPLKCLNWRTPREVFTDLLKRYLLRLAA